MPDAEYGGGNYNSGYGTGGSSNYGGNPTTGPTDAPNTGNSGSYGSGSGNYGGSNNSGNYGGYNNTGNYGGSNNSGSYGGNPTTGPTDAPNTGNYGGSNNSTYNNGGISGALNAGLGGSYVSPNTGSLNLYNSPSVPGGLRGPTGPFGETLAGITPYQTNYQTAQMLRAAYPDSAGKYSQQRVTDALNTFSQAIPGEADYNRYGPASFNNIARVGLNQIIGGYSPEKMVAGMDTTGLRPATRGYEFPGANSIGLTENWQNRLKGDAYQAIAANALQEALRNQGVSPIAQNASNFVAAGTPMVRDVDVVGDPVYGTQYGSDPTWGTRIADRNLAALNSPALAGSTPTGPLSDPSTTGPIQLAMAGMGGSVPASVSPSSINAPYSNIADKGDLQPIPTQVVTDPRVAMALPGYTPSVPGPMTSAQALPSYYSMTNPTQAPYNPATSPGPVQMAMNEPTVPTVPPSQEGTPIPYPVDENSLGYKFWRGGTQVADALLPGSGALFRYMDDDLKQRWPSMTNAQRQALIDKWNNKADPGYSGGNWTSGGGGQVADGGDSPTFASYAPPTTTYDTAPAMEPINVAWKQAAIQYGFTPAQLKDPEIAAYIKQLYEMGWFA